MHNTFHFVMLRTISKVDTLFAQRLLFGRFCTSCIASTELVVGVVVQKFLLQSATLVLVLTTVSLPVPVLLITSRVRVVHCKSTSLTNRPYEIAATTLALVLLVVRVS